MCFLRQFRVLDKNPFSALKRDLPATFKQYRINLEIIILCEVNQRKTNMLGYRWNLKKYDTNELTYKTLETDLQKHREKQTTVIKVFEESG